MSNQRKNSNASSASTSTAFQMPFMTNVLGSVLTPAAAAVAIANSKCDFVQVDALVLLKILKNCQEVGGGAEMVQGILTGMVQTQDGKNGQKRIEITNCFGLPNPNNLKGSDYDDICNTLITNNLQTFRHLNIDHLIVGWYQSSLFGKFINKTFIEGQYDYQSALDDSIVLIYDPFKTQHGSISLKAYRLSESMMELQKKKDFSPDRYL
jgi:translation initiation factor 3 subunit H